MTFRNILDIRICVFGENQIDETVYDTIFDLLTNRSDVLCMPLLSSNSVRFFKDIEFNIESFDADYCYNILILGRSIKQSERRFLKKIKKISIKNGDTIFPIRCFNTNDTEFGEIHSITLPHQSSLDDGYIENFKNELSVRFLESLIMFLTVKSDKNYDEQIFISYRRLDGTEIANEIKSYLDEKITLTSFLDTREIPVGSNFNIIINKKLRISSLICLKTDNFRSQWTLKEVIEARKHNRPLVVIEAMKSGQAETVPYFGNAPSILYQGINSLPQILMTILKETLRVMLAELNLSQLIDNQKDKRKCKYSIRKPDLLDVIWLDDDVELLLYPETKLINSELELLNYARPDLIIQTPSEYEYGEN